jgi:CPA2 family monovalent cation:H+ antiporter-2
LTISASLAQIGEFSFIIASLGLSLGLLPATGRDLILAGAIFSILLNPLLFVVLDRLKPWLDAREGRVVLRDVRPEVAMPAGGHVVLVGFGRVGHRIVLALQEQDLPVVVIVDHAEVVEALLADGIPALYGNGAAPGMLQAANIAHARFLLIAIPDALEAGQIIERARGLNPDIEIVARAYNDAELAHLEGRGG